MDNRPKQYPQPPQYPQYPQNQIQIPLQPGPPPKPRWSRSKKWKVIGIVVAAFLVISITNGIISGGKGIGNQAQDNQPTSDATPTAKPTQTAPLAEHLAFSGDTSGILTTGINPHPLTHDDPIPSFVEQQDSTYFEPAPTLTQCSDFNSGYGQDYIAVIVGNVGTMRYAVTIEISEDNPAYTKPGTELRIGGIDSSNGEVKVYEMGEKNRRWSHVYGPALQDTVIVLHADRVSGTVDTWMAPMDQGRYADSTLHLQGDWRCG